MITITIFLFHFRIDWGFFFFQMSSAKMKPPDLLKCTDGEFDSGIQHLGLKVISRSLEPPHFYRKKDLLSLIYKNCQVRNVSWWNLKFQILTVYDVSRRNSWRQFPWSRRNRVKNRRISTHWRLSWIPWRRTPASTNRSRKRWKAHRSRWRPWWTSPWSASNR